MAEWILVVALMWLGGFGAGFYVGRRTADESTPPETGFAYQLDAYTVTDPDPESTDDDPALWLAFGGDWESPEDEIYDDLLHDPGELTITRTRIAEDLAAYESTPPVPPAVTAFDPESTWIGPILGTGRRYTDDELDVVLDALDAQDPA